MGWCCEGVKTTLKIIESKSWKRASCWVRGSFTIIWKWKHLRNGALKRVVTAHHGIKCDWCCSGIVQRRTSGLSAGPNWRKGGDAMLWCPVETRSTPLGASTRSLKKGLVFRTPLKSMSWTQVCRGVSWSWIKVRGLIGQHVWLNIRSACFIILSLLGDNGLVVGPFDKNGLK